MSYFVVLTNLASIPCIVYYQYHRNCMYALQILFNSMFSFLHHLNWSGLYRFEDKGLFDFLDGLYSYLSIYLFSIYMILSNHDLLRTELFFIQTVLASLVYIQFGAVIVLPVTVFLVLAVTGFHYSHIRPIQWNPYLYVGLLMATADMICFFLAANYEYNYLHGAHHLFAFNLPIVIHRYVSEPVRPELEPRETRLARLHHIIGSPVIELGHPRVLDPNLSPSLIPLRL